MWWHLIDDIFEGNPSDDINPIDDIDMADEYDTDDIILVGIKRNGALPNSSFLFWTPLQEEYVQHSTQIMRSFLSWV